MTTVQGELSSAQATFQERLRRCHAAAGETVPRGERGGEPSASAMASYAETLRPCVKQEVRSLGELFAPAQAAVPAALSAMQAAASANGSALPAGDKKSGSWW